MTSFVKTEATDVESLLEDVATRAAKTFWQAGSIAASAQWAGSGLNLGHLTDFSSVERVVVAAVIAGGSAGASAVYNLISGYVKARKVKLSADLKADIPVVEAEVKTLVDDAK